LILTDEREYYPFDDYRFRLIASGKVGPGKKRNIGASYATGDVLAFLDDDAYPSEDWLDIGAEIFADESVYALGAPAITPTDAKFKEKCSGRILQSALTGGGTTYRHTPMRKALVEDYPSVNLFVRKSVFLSIGGYPAEFWPGEDTKMCLDLVKKYARPFLYDPRPIVYHHRRDIFVPHLKQVSRYGQHRGQFAMIFPETSRLPSYFVPSLFLLGLMFGPVFAFFIPILWNFYTFILLFYLSMVVFEGIRITFYEKNLLMGACSSVGIILTHIVYGYNFLVGLVKRPKFELRKVDLHTGNYLGG